MPPSGVNPLWLQRENALVRKRTAPFGLSSIQPPRPSVRVIQPARAFSQIAQQHGFSDTRSGGITWKEPSFAGHHTHKDGTPYPIEECPIYLGFQKGDSVHRDDEVYWRRDGTSFPVEYWSHPVVQEGRTLGAVITFIDITERKQTEEALRRSEEQNRSLLQINNAIITNLTQEALLHSISEALHQIIWLRSVRHHSLSTRERYLPLSGRGGRVVVGLLPGGDRGPA